MEYNCAYLLSIFCHGLEEFRRHLANAFLKSIHFHVFGVWEVIEGYVVTPLFWSFNSSFSIREPKFGGKQ